MDAVGAADVAGAGVGSAPVPYPTGVEGRRPGPELQRHQLDLLPFGGELPDVVGPPLHRIPADLDGAGGGLGPPLVASPHVDEGAAVGVGVVEGDPAGPVPHRVDPAHEGGVLVDVEGLAPLRLVHGHVGPEAGAGRTLQPAGQPGERPGEGVLGHHRIDPPQPGQHPVGVFRIAALLPVELVRPHHQIVPAVEYEVVPLAKLLHRLQTDQVLRDQKPVLAILPYLGVRELLDHSRLLRSPPACDYTRRFPRRPGGRPADAGSISRRCIR